MLADYSKHRFDEEVQPTEEDVPAFSACLNNIHYHVLNII